jgi:hypothetical protein
MMYQLVYDTKGANSSTENSVPHEGKELLPGRTIFPWSLRDYVSKLHHLCQSKKLRSDMIKKVNTE